MSERAFLPPDPPIPSGDFRLDIQSLVQWARTLTGEMKGYFEIRDYPSKTRPGFASGGETTAGNGAESAKFVAHAALRLTAAKMRVTAAGTSTDHGITIFNGTTSLGTAALGTSSVGVTTSVDLGTAAVDALSLTYAQNSTDATGRAAITYVFEEVLR